MITNEQLQKIEVLFEMLEDNIKRLATHLQDIAIACGVDYTDGDFPIDEVLAVIKSTKLSEWGTTKRCKTCAYWKPIEPSCSWGNYWPWGNCGNNTLEWQESEFCFDWISKEEKRND